MPGPLGVSYCDPSDLPNYLPQAMLDMVDPSELVVACADATAEADSFMRGRYAMPLLAWGADIRRFTAYIACYLVSQKIGYVAQAGSDQQIRERYYQATEYPVSQGSVPGFFRDIQRQARHPDVTPSIEPQNDPVTGLPQVRTSQTRGWQQFNSSGKPVVG